MGLIHKLMIGFFAITLLIWVGAYSAINSSQKLLQSNIEDSSLHLASEILADVERSVYNRISTFQAYSTDILLKKTLEESNRRFAELEDPSAYMDEIDREWVSTPSGSELPLMHEINRGTLSNELREKLEFYNNRNDYPVYGEVFVTNKYGAVIAQTGRTTDFRQDDEYWWKAAKNGGMYTGDVDFDESAGMYSLSTGIRVNDKEGRFIGVIKAVLNLRDIITLMDNTIVNLEEDSGHKIKYKLLTTDNRLIYSSDDDFKFLEDVSLLIPKDDGLHATSAVIHDENVLAVHAHSKGYKEFKGFGWILIVEHRTSDIFSPLISLKNRIIFVALMLTVLAVLISVAFARYLTTGITALKRAAHELGSGDYSVRVTVESEDEFSEVARAFNTMAERLQDTISALDNEIMERKVSEDTVRHMAYHDHLTGLPNRLLFIDRLEQVLLREVYHKRPAAVLFLDLDGFKSINDTLGHAFGDELLKVVARRLESCLREGDTVARLGGDEFTILLQYVAKIEDVPMVLEKIFATLAEPVMINGEEIQVGTSIGVSIYPEDGEDTETLLKHADMAMYRAKASGRNNFQLYTPSMSTKAIEQLKMEKRLLKALDNGDFILNYQPEMDLATGELVGMEALVRMQGDDLGPIPPSDFIPVAEETGIIVPLSEWVLRKACEQHKMWMDAGCAPMTIAVNIAPRMFSQKDFVITVAMILKDTGMDPENLELEITESAMMTDREDTVEKIRALKEIGVRFAIDDFGTGYSSLSYLKHLPLHMLKIDRSFIRDIATDPDDKAIVTAIIRMAHSMNLDVIAEGVETEEQLAIVTSLECDKAQGYLLSKPLTAEAFEEFIRKAGKLPRRKNAV